MMPQALKMRCPNRVLSFLVASALLTGGPSLSTQAKSYSSGGKSYSSHSSSSGSSHSFSSGSGKSFSSGSSHSSGSSSSHSSSSGGGGSRSSSGSSGSSKSFGSSSGKSYSSGSSWSGNDGHGYSSGKSYSSGSSAFKLQSPKAKDQDIGNQKTSSGSSFSFDTAAARARKEEASKQQFTTFKDSQAPPRAQSDSAPGAGSYQAKPPPLPPTRDYYQPTYVPTTVIIQTRPRRIYDVYSPYSYRPWVVYNDPYSSLFWWWLLDRSIDDQAWWAYHHRYDMDPARYQALLNSNQQLEARVAQLEGQQTPRDPTYTPTGLDGRDLMYSDQYVNRAYGNRPTTSGTVAFWLFAVPAAAGGCIFFIWLIWFKRWQTT
jgi:hypothetical protein